MHVAANWAEAARVARRLIEEADPQSVSYGDSMTLRATGLLDEVKARPGITFFDGFQPGMEREEKWDIRRRGMTADLFLTGVNACTEQGTLHWVDMVGNRVAPVAFGPKRVLYWPAATRSSPTGRRRKSASGGLRRSTPGGTTASHPLRLHGDVRRLQLAGPPVQHPHADRQMLSAGAHLGHPGR